MFLPSCRYVPTCSDYAAEAIDKFGAVRGTALAIWRLLRCHPFVRGGFDPVPGASFFPDERVRHSSCQPDVAYHPLSRMPEYKSPQSEPGTEQRFVLVFLLMAAVIFGAQLYMKKYAPAPSTAQPKQATQTAPPSQAPPPSQAAATPAAAHKACSVVLQRPRLPPSRRNPNPRPWSRMIFIASLSPTAAAQAKSWILKKYSDDQGRPLDIVNQAAAAKYGYPLSFWSSDESLRNQLNSALYVASESGTVSAPTNLIFEYSANGSCS